MCGRWGGVGRARHGREPGRGGATREDLAFIRQLREAFPGSEAEEGAARSDLRFPAISVLPCEGGFEGGGTAVWPVRCEGCDLGQRGRDRGRAMLGAVTRLGHQDRGHTCHVRCWGSGGGGVGDREVGAARRDTRCSPLALRCGAWRVTHWTDALGLADLLCPPSGRRTRAAPRVTTGEPRYDLPHLAGFLSSWLPRMPWERHRCVAVSV